MRIRPWVSIIPIIIIMLVLSIGCTAETVSSTEVVMKITLPEPVYDSDTSIEEALLARRSVRNFSEEPITLQQLSQLLWVGQGITDPSGKRTAPSAGALYPLKLYVVVGNVEGLAAGIYEYEPETHALVKSADGDQRTSLAQVALGQASVEQGALDIVITAIYEITTIKYGERGIRYVHMEAGHAAQNICLEAVALELGAVTIGAFDDAGVQQVLGLPDNEVPLYIIPIGNPVN
ncbi:MAG: SagB/ThcOx family dehydrogenase [Dehalococcoidales bacterium]|nr:SagB/ThcOx family dehydrogenase [Dehalococcoidales bacterium]